MSQELLIFRAPELIPIFSDFRVDRSLVFYVGFCVDHYVSFFAIFFLAIVYLTFDLQLLITPMVSSSSS